MTGASLADDVAAGRSLRVLLVEDDEGDAVLVTELLAETAAPIELVHVPTLAKGLAVASDFDCVLLDLNLPDATGLDGLQALRSGAEGVAILVLTGLADERGGMRALAAGAQDYLVKGAVDGPLLARSIRYAVERRRAEGAQRQLTLARAQAAENARLERGLLPTPLVGDERLEVAAHYRAGRRRALLGGDFYDIVEDRDGAVHAVIGDVCGHGPDEAALGVSLRIAWRTLVVSGAPDAEILPTLQDVLAAERLGRGVFTTLATVTLPPDRRSLALRTAGHPAPLLLTPAGVEIMAETPSGPPIGIIDEAGWPATEFALPEGWSLLLYTDGVIEGRIGDGTERLGMPGFSKMVAQARREHPEDAAALVRRVVERAEQLNAGPLLDDVALVLIASSA